MKLIGIHVMLAAGVLFFLSCNKDQDNYDASGSFEAEETIISAEASGALKAFNIEEGQMLEAGQIVGYIDSVQLHLKKKQLEAQLAALLSKKPDISIQLSALQQRLKAAEKEQVRMVNLVQGDAATPKQLDDINAQVTVLKKQIEAQRSSLTIANKGINKEAVPLQLQVEQLEDALGKCRIVNPIQGTVLTKYAEAHEVVANGKPLYKIADLSGIILRAYVTANQLTQIRLNQKVTVWTDEGNGKANFHKSEGVITWISDQAEFTPKTVQTKDERANLVYAIKIKVKNDGLYKIGMYGEVSF